MKYKKKSAFWLIAFVVGFVVFYLIGNGMYVRGGLVRPLYQHHLHYTVFCNLPFYISKVFGVGARELMPNLWSAFVATYFLVCGIGLYIGEDKKGYEANLRIGHFMGAFALCSFMTNVMISSAQYDFTNQKMVTMSLYASAVYIIYFCLRRFFNKGKKMREGERFRVFCYQIAGLSLAMATAGYTRVLWNTQAAYWLLLPVRALKYLALFSFKIRGGLMGALIGIAGLGVLMLAFVFLCYKLSRMLGGYWIGFLYTAVIMMICFLTTKSMNDASYHIPTVKHWVFMVISVILWTCRMPKKRLLTFVLLFAFHLLLYMLIMAHYIYFENICSCIGEFVANLQPFKTKLLETCAKVFKKATPDDAVDYARACFVVHAVIMTLVAHLLHRFFVGLFTGDVWFKPKWDTGKPHWFDYSLGHTADFPQFLAAFFLSGVAVYAIGWDYLVVKIAAYVVLLIGIYGLGIVLLNALRKKDKNMLICLLFTFAAIAMLLPFYVVFGGGIAMFVVSLVLAIGFVAMDGGSAGPTLGDILTGDIGLEGGVPTEQAPRELSFGEQMLATMWMTSSLDSIDKAVGSGAMNYYEGVFYSHMVVDKAAEMGVFGRSDR